MKIGQEIVQNYGQRWFTYHDNIGVGDGDDGIAGDGIVVDHNPSITVDTVCGCRGRLCQLFNHMVTFFSRQIACQMPRRKYVQSTRQLQSNPKLNPQSNSQSDSQSNSQSNSPPSNSHSNPQPSSLRSSDQVRLPGCPTMTTGMSVCSVFSLTYLHRPRPLLLYVLALWGLPIN